MTSVQLFCRMCGIRFVAEPSPYEGEACSEDCWDNLQDVKRNHFRQRVLRIAELDPCPELDEHLITLVDTDLHIDRYVITGRVHTYFKGPPGGWPPGVGLEFPIATLELRGESQRRVFGLANVIDLIQELSQPCFLPTKKFTKRTI